MVAQTGSLTKATDKSHMTLSALSKRIADLERTVDTALFVRLPRGLELTPAGEQLAHHARSVLDTVNRMAGEMEDFAIGVRGHVRIWANTSAIIQFLPADLASFVEVHPLIRISLEEMLSDQIVTAVLSGEADLGIFADNVSSRGLEKYLYRRDKLMVVVRADHALATLPAISFSDTLNYDFVGLNHGSSLLKRLTDASLTHDKPLRLRIQVSSFDGMCRMIAAGLGIGVLPDGAVPPELLASNLRAIPLTDTWAQRTLWLGVKSEAALVPEASKLLAHLRAADKG
ncbi:GntR family transcriptional regulator [Undibacterium sp. KW1]|nr:GntR family transcriptional regulator [Undibacterium sp. KW1]